MRSLVRVAITGVALCVPFLCGWADECPVSLQYQYYVVEGATAPSLKESLRQRGPRDDSGDVRFAYTDWTVKWSWKIGEGGGVDISSVKLSCQATILLPKVESLDALPLGVREGWSLFVERTRRHELNHVGHVEEIAPKIIGRLRQAAAESGEVSPRRAEGIVSEVIAAIKARDRRYDSETNHGQTEGTWEITL